MDSSELDKESTTIDINTEEWCDNEEFELYSEENDLFLHDEYIQTSNKNVLPFKVSIPAQIPFVQNQTDGLSPRNKTQLDHEEGPIDEEVPLDGDTVALIGSTRPNSPATSSIYQSPNFQQFSSNFVPSSPASIFASFVIVFVILFVTVLPILTPQQLTSSITSTSANDIEQSSANRVISNSTIADTFAEHSDVRCKCICPPQLIPASNKSSSDRSKQPNSSPNQRILYVGNSTPNQCNCNNVVLPRLADLKSLSRDFCVGCECRYQSRNTANIRRNVIFFIMVLTGLSIYMFIQYLFKYFKITRRSLPRRLKWLSFQITESD